VAEERPEQGVIASLRRVAATLLKLARTRLELVSVEFEEQFEYAVSLLLWGVAAIFFGSLAVLLVALTIVIAFWDQHRLLAAGLVTAAFLLAAVVAASVVRNRLRRRPRFLAATARELQRDSAALDGEPRG
jgi:uncharacterized membrane protein YqjE